ncbi:uncharacterized protein LOC123300848 isoform X2 [Chrysoperla carnea]|uniref:uncharacterized protein LOC123300848 isoform X2 n=1 Tax=Chrysoperla carnea TaxID=189513 RepID=UPI001D07DC76|nr:uncharacterized protein LOC123300848 isoform X2 [Chrysoperla carnea]
MKKCLICRFPYSPICGRSFHKFPSNVDMQGKWLKALNLSTLPNLKTSYICSDHFSEHNFYDCEESRKKPKLLRDAIPQIFNTSLTNDEELREVVSEQSMKLDVCITSSARQAVTNSVADGFNEDVTKISQESSGVPIAADDIKKEVLQCSAESSDVPIAADDIKKEVLQCRAESCDVPIAADDIKKEVLQCRADENAMNYVDMDIIDSNISTEVTQSYTPTPAWTNEPGRTTLNSPTMKRKKVILNGKIVKKVKFRVGPRTEYFSRNDCISDEAWQKFLQLYRQQELRIAAIRNQNCRKQKKIDSLSSLIQNLKAKGADSVASIYRNMFRTSSSE